MAEAVLEAVLENLSSLIQKQLGSFLGVDQEMRRLSRTLTTIQAVLEDAEEKQLTNRPIKIWLQELKDATHVLDDILDECATEAIRLEYQGMKFGLANKGRRLVLCYFCPKHILFRCKIAQKMKNMSQKLDEIAEERSKFHLRETVIIQSGVEVMGWRETTSIITEPQVYGREEDKEKIVDYLVGQASNSEDLSVYPIVGMGGLGKTTLAQLIFNDDRVAKHFEPRIWVCVSNDFDLKRILKAIVESATGHASEDMGLEALQKKVQGLVERKRYLLILDDVWNDNLEQWNKLKYVVACGSKGASILTTTRLAKVALVMRTMPPHELSILSEDDCWALFKHTAFGPDKGELGELVAIGKDIVKKCGGVPLAAKALGGLLRFKNEEKEWLYVKESNLWSIPQEEDSIMPTLSYLNLSVKLRQCFAFCAIFPKDEEIDKHFLIDLWMANGFISSNENLDVEDAGDEVWKELCWRSFFQDIKTDELGKISFKIHDLVHDLAQTVVAEEVCCIDDSNGFTNLSERTHHLFINTRLSANQCDLLQLPQVKSSKTCIMQAPRVDHCLPYLLKCHSLRVLQCTYLIEFSSSVGHLRHLRYLNLSHGRFKILSESICSLWNLQILNLNHCDNLQRLPKSLTRLRALRHLHLIGCSNLSSLPSGMGQLTFLKTLNVYIVDEKEGLLLAELEHLKLRGELHIQHLEKVRSVMDAKKANMVNKNLDRLMLSWWDDEESESQRNVEQILEALEPHPQLKYLMVEGYRGIHFPQWMGSATFKYLYDVKLAYCNNCLQLPSLGKLPSLKRLKVENMNKVRYVDEESYIGGAATGFKALEYLRLSCLPNLERLSKEDGQNIFPRLSEMFIDKCPKLLALPSLPCLGKLRIEGKFSQALLDSIHNLHNLESHRSGLDRELASFPDGMLRNPTSLERISIEGYSQLKVFQIKLTSLNALEELHIHKCNSLELITEQTWQGLNSLKTLTIYECPKLKLSDGFQYLTSLQHLSLRNCSEVEEGLPSEILQHLTALQSLRLFNLQNLASLPDCFGSLSNLHRLYIFDCPKLMCLPISIQGLCNLEHLEIGYLPYLASLPDCFGSLSNLHGLYIYDCPKLMCLPISIQGLSNLEQLDISRLENLASLPDCFGSLSNLHRLYIFDCPKLMCLPISIQGLCNLEHLEIGYLPYLASLPDCFGSLSNLRRLYIYDCPKLMCLPISIQGLCNLEVLIIRSLENLASLPDWFGSLSNLRRLDIYNCPKLMCFPISIQGLCNLEQLEINRLPNLASLPDCFGSLSNLHRLYIYDCPKLMCLPISIQGLCNLEELDIYDCPELKKRCEKETGEDWHKIAHVRNIRVV